MCLFQTKSSWIFVSSMGMLTYRSKSEKFSFASLFEILTNIWLKKITIFWWVIKHGDRLAIQQINFHLYLAKICFLVFVYEWLPLIGQERRIIMVHNGSWERIQNWCQHFSFLLNEQDRPQLMKVFALDFCELYR